MDQRILQRPSQPAQQPNAGERREERAGNGEPKRWKARRRIDVARQNGQAEKERQQRDKGAYLYDGAASQGRVPQASPPAVYVARSRSAGRPALMARSDNDAAPAIARLTAGRFANSSIAARNSSARSFSRIV